MQRSSLFNPLFLIIINLAICHHHLNITKPLPIPRPWSTTPRPNLLCPSPPSIINNNRLLIRLSHSPINHCRNILNNIPFSIISNRLPMPNPWNTTRTLRHSRLNQLSTVKPSGINRLNRMCLNRMVITNLIPFNRNMTRSPIIPNITNPLSITRLNLATCLRHLNIIKRLPTPSRWSTTPRPNLLCPNRQFTINSTRLKASSINPCLNTQFSITSHRLLMPNQ
jgi:hypothetical protein